MRWVAWVGHLKHQGPMCSWQRRNPSSAWYFAGLPHSVQNFALASMSWSPFWGCDAGEWWLWCADGWAADVAGAADNTKVAGVVGAAVGFGDDVPDVPAGVTAFGVASPVDGGAAVCAGVAVSGDDLFSDLFPLGGPGAWASAPPGAGGGHGMYQMGLPTALLARLGRMVRSQLLHQ